MARKKVTTEEAQRIKKTREIKQRKNSLKAEQEYDVCAICDDGGSVTCCDGGCGRSFHLDDGDEEEHEDCREKLGLTLEQAKMIINMDEGFICKNCQYKQHQCFACGLLGSSDDTSSQPEVFQCSHDDCAHFYHPKCIAQLLYPNSEEATLFEVEVAAAREKFTCPVHECIECKGVENKNDRSMQFAVCRRCPTVYHRKCLPSDIIFKSRKGPNGSLQRAWDDILPDRILIFCMKHKLVRKLRTPERNHIIFPEANELHMPNTPEGAPWNKICLRKSRCTTISPLPSKLRRLHRLQATRTSATVPVPSHSLQAPHSRNHIQALAVGSMTDHTPYNLSVSCRQ